MGFGMVKRRSKVVRLVDGRQINGGAARALRKVLKEIEDCRSIGVNLTSIRRDGSVYTFSVGEDAIKQLGALKLLEQEIMIDNFNCSKEL